MPFLYRRISMVLTLFFILCFQSEIQAQPDFGSKPVPIPTHVLLALGGLFGIGVKYYQQKKSE